MKLRRVHIKNFKGLREVDIDLQPEGAPCPQHMHCLLGDNGSGKSSVLQAIALTLSLATRRTYKPETFRWNGFLPGRLNSFGRARVEMEVVFDDEEIEATQRLFRFWKESRPTEEQQSNGWTEPGNHSQVTLIYENGAVHARQGLEAKVQFLGRYYVKGLMNAMQGVHENFRRLGDVFWYDQYRNLGEVGTDWEEDDKPVGWNAGVGKLRESLVGKWFNHLSARPGRAARDIAKINEHLAAIFPGTALHGAEPMPHTTEKGFESFYLLLKRGDNVFDLAEMSSGEQAVFSLIYDAVHLSICKSIVLIDELELHLHPPEQQVLLNRLSTLAPDCQFIITTHSKHIESVIPQHHETRLPGGRLWL